MRLQRSRLDNRLDGHRPERHTDTVHFTEKALRELPLASELHKLDERRRQQAQRTGRYAVWDSDLAYWACRVGMREKTLFVVRKLNRELVWHRLGRVGQRPLSEFRTEAEHAASRMLKGEDPRAPKVRAASGVLTLNGALEGYLEAKGAALAPATVKSYRQDFEATFGDWGTRPFTAITSDLAHRRHRERSAESPSRADGALRVLRLVWRFTKANADLEGKPFPMPDPIAKVRLAKTWNGATARSSYLDDRTRPAWLGAVRALPDDKPPALTGTQRDALLLLAATGLRLREAIRLPWREVDLKRGVITVGRARMKGNLEHVLPVPRRTLAMLKTRRKADPEGEFVFANAGRPLDRISAHVFKRIRVRATPHDLRRTVSTWLGGNAPGYVVKQVLSHADVAKARDVTERYVQRDLDVLRTWLQRWEDVLYAGPKKGRRQ